MTPSLLPGAPTPTAGFPSGLSSSRTRRLQRRVWTQGSGALGTRLPHSGPLSASTPPSRGHQDSPTSRPPGSTPLSCRLSAAGHACSPGGLRKRPQRSPLPPARLLPVREINGSAASWPRLRPQFAGRSVCLAFSSQRDSQRLSRDHMHGSDFRIAGSGGLQAKPLPRKEGDFFCRRM